MFTASEIVSNIEIGEWTASQVLEAYITRAALAHERTNCLTEGAFYFSSSSINANSQATPLVVFLQRARQRAGELDVEFATTKKLRGPLHGVPVSQLSSSIQLRTLLTFILSD